MPKIYKPEVVKKYDIGIIPHIIDEESVREYFKDYSKSSGKKIKIISLRCDDIKNDTERIIKEINSCSVTISSSLHGLITSHSYNIPSLWVEFSDKVIGDGFKFRDYFSAHIDNYTEYPNYLPYNIKNLSQFDIDDVINKAFNSFIDLNKSIDEAYEFYSEIFSKIK